MHKPLKLLMYDFHQEKHLQLAFLVVFFSNTWSGLPYAQKFHQISYRSPNFNLGREI